MSYLAEQNIIGSLLMDFECISEVYSILSQEMFLSGVLGRVYLEFQRGYDGHYAVNAVVLEQKLRNAGFSTEELMRELGSCAMNTITSATIRTYAEIVVSDYKARRLRNYLGAVKISADGIDGQIGRILEELEALREGREAGAKTMAEIARENKVKYFCEGGPKMKIGFPRLDDMLGGLEGGDMTVIGARPAVGKSALVAQIASFLAGQQKRVGFYNLEMQEKQIYERFVVARSGIGLARLRKAIQFLGDEKERFDRANQELEKEDNIVIVTGSRTVREIRAESRHMGYDVIIIDYLQLVRPDRAYQGNRVAEVGAVSREIKSLAMELNIPIIALSQLNRMSLAGEKEPSMAELREAGDIEQDASVIMLLWNLGDSGKKGCKIEKQRQGRTGKVVLRFNGDLMRFEETGESVKEAKAWARVEDDDCPFR